MKYRVAVLRQGKLVAEAPAQGTTQGQLAQWMVGHAIEAAERRPAQNVGEPICTLTNVSTAPTGRDRLNDVSLTLRAGEIVAIAGVSGNGQVALADVLCGVRAAATGWQPWVTRESSCTPSPKATPDSPPRNTPPALP